MRALMVRIGWIATGIVLVVILAFSLGLGVALGDTWIPPLTVWSVLVHRLPIFDQWIHPHWSSVTEQIVIEMRLPRVFLALTVGSALSLSGAVFQGLFRNPLADSYTTGVSAGACFGAVIAIVCGWAVSFTAAIPLCAFVAAVLTTILVYQLASTRGQLQVMHLLLAGVAVSSVLTAFNSLLMYMNMGTGNLTAIIGWTMGHIQDGSWDRVAQITPWLILGLVIVSLASRELDAMQLGEETARHLGINVERVKVLLLGAGVLLTAAAVSVSGIIGFVGLVIPNMLRLIVGPVHRRLLPLSTLVGGIFLVLADAFSRVLFPGVFLPIGVVTALLGGPYFIYLLIKTKNLTT